MLDVSRSDFTAAVAGAGTMGRGIAQVLAQCGARTLLYDAQPGAAGRAIDSIAQALGRQAEKGRIQDPGAIVKRIEVVPGLPALAPCHVVIEAIVEDLAPKRVLFSELEGIVGERCILASNTSSLSVTAMAAACKRPGRVAGYHFFNPVPVLKIVEVVDGVRTEPWVTDALAALAKRFGHTPVRCKDTPGFIVNHAGRAFVPESLRVLAEGVADFATIDRILVDAAGFRLGPFGLMDLVGLDVAHAVMKSMYQQYFEEPKYRPSFIAEPRVAAGLLGRKTGRGWYEYPGGSMQAIPEPAAPKKMPDAVWVVPVPVINDSPGFVAHRVVAHIVTDGCDIMQMRICSPEDLDRAVMLGLGYPKGPLGMGDAIGAGKVLQVLDAMHSILQEPRYRA